MEVLIINDCLHNNKITDLIKLINNNEINGHKVFSYCEEKSRYCFNYNLLYLLGYLFKNGIGTEQNLEKAEYNFGQAIAEGSMDALYELVAIYEETKKYKNAIHLYNIAYTKGNTHIIQKLEELYDIVDLDNKHEIEKILFPYYSKIEFHHQNKSTVYIQYLIYQHNILKEKVNMLEQKILAILKN